jgi:hypothetical protein
VIVVKFVNVKSNSLLEAASQFTKFTNGNELSEVVVNEVTALNRQFDGMKL